MGRKKRPRLSDEECVAECLRLRETKEWHKTLPDRAASVVIRGMEIVSRTAVWRRGCHPPLKWARMSQEYYTVYEKTLVHSPGDLVVPRCRKGVSPFRYFYIGTYAKNGYGAYRLLRNDGKLASAGAIENPKAKPIPSKKQAVKFLLEQCWELMRNDDFDQMTYLVRGMFPDDADKLLEKLKAFESYDEYVKKAPRMFKKAKIVTHS